MDCGPAWARTGIVMVLGLLAGACTGDDGPSTLSESGSATTTTGASTITPTVTTATETTAGPTSVTVANTDPTSSSTTESICPMGQIVCEDGEAKVCDGAGGFEEAELCAQVCVDGLGCASCVPGETLCDDGDSTICAEDGAGYELLEVCDPMQGLSCEAGSGTCTGPCAADELGLGNVGCEFFPTPIAGLQTGDPWAFNFSVAVVNAGAEVANIRVTRGDVPVLDIGLAAESALELDLPYVDELANAQYDEAEPSVLAEEGAYRLRSDRPITAFQYNPRGYKIGPNFSYSSDGSVLPPVHTWGTEYRVVSRNHWVDGGDEHYSGVYAVTARFDDTTVHVEPSDSGVTVLAGGGISADGTGQVELDAGDVLQVVSGSAGGEPDASDLTGTRVLTDKPVQVIGGHKCTNVPHDVAACDRLEEALPPVSALGTTHVVAAPLIPTGGPVPKVQMVRITAAYNDTDLGYEPAIQGAPVTIFEAGDYVELGPLNDDFVITSSRPVVVTQYMVGQGGGGNSGDPAFVMTVPTSQYRDRYEFHASGSYELSYVSVIAEDGASVLLDGVPLAPFEAIGGSDYAVVRTPLPNAIDGRYVLSSPDGPFAATVYGYGQFTSYWFSAGQRYEPR